MSIAIAKQTLNRAFAELDRADDNEEIRQAAEKAWRAVCEAVYAVMAAFGVPTRGTVNVFTVGAFEAKHLKRPQGKPCGQPLSLGYGWAQSGLHGDCFYGGVVPDRAELRANFEQARAVIEQAEMDIAQNAARRRR